MQRLQKIGKIKQKHSSEIKTSKIGIGFEKLDRDVFDPEKAYDKVADIGVKWVRIQSGWAKTEKQKGVYNFSWLDNIVENLLSRGMKPWICLCYGNGLYNEEAKQYFGAVGVPPIFTEEQKTAWANYVEALVERYKGKVTHYEIWNEPDNPFCWKHGVNAHELGVFTAETGKIIHRTDPSATVIGLVQCGANLKYMSDAFEGTEMAENIDALSFHEYVVSETSVPERVESMRAIADHYRKGIKIIQGESGSQSRAGGNGALADKLWTEKAQMKQLARHLMIDLSVGVEFSSYFSCMDMIEALQGTVDNKASYLDYGYFGVLRAEFDENGFSIGSYSEKPSYYALQTMASVFAEEIEVKNAPVLFRPEYFDGYNTFDCSRNQVVSAYFERPDGEQCFVYWNPTNILTTDYCGSVSFQFITKHEDLKLVDLCTGDVYALPDDMFKKENLCAYLSHLPIKDYPLALVTDAFCNFDKE